MFNANVRPGAQEKKLLKSLEARIIVPDHPSREWSDHEVSTLLGLMARQLHTSSNRIRLATLFKERLSVHSANHKNEITPGDTHAKLHQILGTRLAFSKMLLRVNSKRLTRTLRRSFERGLKFTGDVGVDPEEEKAQVAKAAGKKSTISLVGSTRVDAIPTIENLLDDVWGVGVALNTATAAAPEANLDGWGSLDDLAPAIASNAGAEDAGWGSLENPPPAIASNAGAEDAGWGSLDNSAPAVGPTTGSQDAGWGTLDTAVAESGNSQQADSVWIADTAFEQPAEVAPVDAAWGSLNSGNQGTNIDAGWGIFSEDDRDTALDTSTVDDGWGGIGNDKTCAIAEDSGMDMTADTLGDQNEGNGSKIASDKQPAPTTEHREIAKVGTDWSAGPQIDCGRNESFSTHLARDGLHEQSGSCWDFSKVTAEGCANTGQSSSTLCDTETSAASATAKESLVDESSWGGEGQVDDDVVEVAWGGWKGQPTPVDEAPKANIARDEDTTEIPHAREPHGRAANYHRRCDVIQGNDHRMEPTGRHDPDDAEMIKLPRPREMITPADTLDYDEAVDEVMHAEPGHGAANSVPLDEPTGKARDMQHPDRVDEAPLTGSNASVLQPRKTRTDPQAPTEGTEDAAKQ